MSEPLTGGSLFTGYGGLDMAANAVLGPIDFIWHSDIKPAAITLLDHRYPEVPNLGDITVLDPRDVSPVHVLTFGWPCQPHSSAGKRLGEADPRALWPHVHRIIAGLRPPILLGENVSRVTSNGELRRVVRSLAEIGYVGLWRSVNASDVKAPHRRSRLFLLAFRADSLDSLADTLRAKLRNEPRRGCRSCGPSTRVTGDDGSERAAGLSLLPTPGERLGGSRGTPNSTTAQARMDSGRRNLDDAVALLPTPAHRDAHRGEGWGNLPGRPLSETIHRVVQGWGEYGRAVSHWERTLGQAAPVAVQIGSRTGRPQLSPAFVEWMMGLPAGWVTDVPGLTRSQQLSMLGDGVVPQQGAHAYEQLITDLFTVRTREGAA